MKLISTKLKNYFKNKKQGESFEEILSEFKLKNFTQKQILDNKLVQKIPTKSIILINLFTLMFFGLFFYQAYNLQIIKGQEFIEKASNNQFVSVPILPMRGKILDRNGIVLAETIKKEITSASNLDHNFYRQYTKKEGLAHVLGYVSYPQKDSSGKYWQHNFVGVTGVEAYYNQLLSGRPGKKIYEKTAEGLLQTSFITEQAIEGKDVQLSIDSELNEFAYHKLKDYVLKHGFQGGSINIMDIKTGEIIIMTNYPEYKIDKLISTSYDTNEDKKEKKKYLEEISRDPQTPLLNRAISGVYAPGSTLKPIFALAALHHELIDPSTSIYSPGFIEIPNVIDPNKKNVFRDWKAHGWVNVRTALANSSDVFFYAIGGGYEKQKGLGISKIKDWAHLFGVDTLTGIDLPGEKKGNIPTPEWKKRIFNEPWYLGDTYISSIGQFGFLVTPLSLTRMSAAFANEGILLIPSIRKNQHALKTKKISIEVKKEWYKIVQEGMRMTVTNGTAKGLNSDLVKISGKSGTAEVGVQKDKIQSWITGYFPYDNPRYAFTFLCELGKKDISPTPNLLAKEVIEKMYLTDEYYQKIEGRELKVIAEPKE